jgi:hypothetical protein
MKNRIKLIRITTHKETFISHLFEPYCLKKKFTLKIHRLRFILFKLLPIISLRLTV